MSILAYAWSKRQKTGSPTLKAVLMAVADYADEHGKAWPSQKRIAEDTELSVRSVRDALAALEAKGFLNREPYHRPDNSRGADIITLNLSRQGEVREARSGGEEAIAGGRETAAGGVGKDVPGGGETVSPLTTFEPPPEPPKEPSKSNAVALRAQTEAEFAIWYEGYPRKVAKPSALKAFVKARKKASLADLIAGVRRYIEMKPPDISYAYPATWLNDERWTDEPSLDQDGKPRRGFAGNHSGEPRGIDAVFAAVDRIARQRGLTERAWDERLDEAAGDSSIVDADWIPAPSH